MQIVPLDDKLLIEAKVRPADIAQIRSGLPAAIRFDAFDYTIYGAVDGTVIYVSADTIKEESKAGEQTYYRVHVETSGNPVRTRTGKQLDIMPGMTAQVDIRTGNRTVLEYILKPLRKTMTESMGER
jgi:adhesin transport system membrane fusion protein